MQTKILNLKSGETIATANSIQAVCESFYTTQMPVDSLAELYVIQPGRKDPLTDDEQAVLSDHKLVFWFDIPHDQVTYSGTIVQGMTKHDGNKLRFDLIPPHTLKQLAAVLEHGAVKYGVDNWRNSTPEDITRFRSAHMRHYEAYRAGEYIDEETKLPHLVLAMTNLMIIHELTHETASSQD